MANIVNSGRNGRELNTAMKFVPKLDEEGKPVLKRDEKGNPIVKRHPDGRPVMAKGLDGRLVFDRGLPVFEYEHEGTYVADVTVDSTKALRDRPAGSRFEWNPRLKTGDARGEFYVDEPIAPGGGSMVDSEGRAKPSSVAKVFSAPSSKQAGAASVKFETEHVSIDSIFIDTNGNMELYHGPSFMDSSDTMIRGFGCVGRVHAATWDYRTPSRDPKSMMSPGDVAGALLQGVNGKTFSFSPETKVMAESFEHGVKVAGIPGGEAAHARLDDYFMYNGTMGELADMSASGEDLMTRVDGYEPKPMGWSLRKGVVVNPDARPKEYVVNALQGVKSVSDGFVLDRTREAEASVDTEPLPSAPAVPKPAYERIAPDTSHIEEQTGPDDGIDYNI